MHIAQQATKRYLQYKFYKVMCIGWSDLKPFPWAEFWYIEKNDTNIKSYEMD